MKVTVKIPATTANLGPGFDCFGMALPIYNEITVEETVMPGSGVEINIISENYKTDYEHAKTNDDVYNLYLRFLMVTDYISGMTDSFAKNLYRELNGLD